MQNIHKESKITNNIGKNAAQLTITKTVVLMVGLVNGMVLARFRTLEEFGTFSQLNMAISLFTTLIMMGLPSSINYFMMKGESKNDRANFLSTYYSLSTLLSILSGLGLLFLMPLIANYFNNPLIRIFAFYLVLMPWINIIQGSIGNILIVYGKTSLLSLYNIITSLIVLGILLFSVLLNLTFVNYVYIFTVSQVIITISVYFIVFKLANGIRFSLDKFLIKMILGYSIPLGLATIVGTISIELDKLLIGYIFDTETLAIYTNAARELPFSIVSSSITAVLLPQMVKLINTNKISEAITLWRESITLSYIFMSFFTSVLIVFAPQIITILYSDKYLPGVSVFRIYSIVILIRTTYFGMLLNSMGKTKYIAYISVFNLVLNVVLNILFYFIFGLIGPALATIVAMVISSGVYMLLNAKVIKVRIGDILSYGELLKISVCNIILSLIVWLIVFKLNLSVSRNDIITSIGLGFVWLILYLVLNTKLIITKWRSLSL